MSYVGRSVPRVDARDKAAGRAMYAADLCDRRALTAKILHAEQAHALVKRIDAEKARAMEGVEAVFTSTLPAVSTNQVSLETFTPSLFSIDIWRVPSVSVFPLKTPLSVFVVSLLPVRV